MRMLLAVAAGSAVGGVTRFALGAWLQQRSPAHMPWATLLINVTGSLLLGVLATWNFERAGTSPEMRALLTTGLCGGYTTFSTFSLETFALADEGEWGRAALYVALSVTLSLGAAALGVVGTRHLLRPPAA